MTITLSLRSSDGRRFLKVVVAAAALVVEPAVPRRLEAVEGPGRRRRLRGKVGVVRADGRDDRGERPRRLRFR